jgi:hypothetical protein
VFGRAFAFAVVDVAVAVIAVVSDDSEHRADGDDVRARSAR